MTERMIENRIKKLSALEEQIAQLQEQADIIKGELKADLEEKGLDELKTKNFLIRWRQCGTWRSRIQYLCGLAGDFLCAKYRFCANLVPNDARLLQR